MPFAGASSRLRLASFRLRTRKKRRRMAESAQAAVFSGLRGKSARVPGQASLDMRKRWQITAQFCGYRFRWSLRSAISSAIFSTSFLASRTCSRSVGLRPRSQAMTAFNVWAKAERKTALARSRLCKRMASDLRNSGAAAPSRERLRQHRPCGVARFVAGGVDHWREHRPVFGGARYRIPEAAARRKYGDAKLAAPNVRTLPLADVRRASGDQY